MSDLNGTGCCRFTERTITLVRTARQIPLLSLEQLHRTSKTMTAVMNSSSPITQVSQAPIQTNLQPQLLSRLFLDLRGRRFEVDRDTIMNLPESVLLCLFPSGLVLSRQSMALSEGGEHDEEEDVYGVDVSVNQQYGIPR